MKYGEYKSQLSGAQPVAASYNPYGRKRAGKGWLAAALIILAVAGWFAYNVYREVMIRRAEVAQIMYRAKHAVPKGLIGNAQTVSQLAGEISQATATTSSSTASSTGMAQVLPDKDSKRTLAEKTDRPSLGNPTSSLVIVEFADFQCPECLKEFSQIRTITAKYSKDLLFIFRGYPVINDMSTVLANAGYCAQEQGKFWQFHDKVYLSDEAVSSIDDIKSLALASGLNWSKMEPCVSGNRYQAKVMQDTSDAVDLGVRGTPTFFVNGNKLEGVVPTATWEQIIAKSKELNNTTK